MVKLKLTHFYIIFHYFIFYNSKYIHIFYIYIIKIEKF